VVKALQLISRGLGPVTTPCVNCNRGGAVVGTYTEILLKKIFGQLTSPHFSVFEEKMLRHLTNSKIWIEENVPQDDQDSETQCLGMNMLKKLLVVIQEVIQLFAPHRLN
jgi:hypothetical protein